MRWLGSDGVLIDPQTGAYLYFSAVAEDDLIQLLFGNSGNPIASIELLGGGVRVHGLERPARRQDGHHVRR